MHNGKLADSGPLGYGSLFFLFGLPVVPWDMEACFLFGLPPDQHYLLPLSVCKATCNNDKFLLSSNCYLCLPKKFVCFIFVVDVKHQNINF